MKVCISSIIIFLTVGQLMAQCTEDLDCKDGRICVEGKCQEPQNQNSPCKKDVDCHGDSICDNGRCVAGNDKSQKSRTFASASDEHHNTGGFATGSGIAGIVLSPIMLGLTIGSAATSGNGFVPALPLGATALGIGVISVPVIAAGGGSARRSEQVNGVLGLRIAGWSGYGLSLGTGAVMVGLAVGGATIPSGPILACGILGTISCLSLSIDNLVSGAQAKKKFAKVDNSFCGPELTFGIGPYSKNGAIVQLGLRF